MLNKLFSVIGLSKSQKDEIQQEISLFEAIQVHISWKKKLVDFIDGKSAVVIQPHHASLDNRCTLGKWIHSSGRLYFGSHPFFQQLEEEHAKFHYCASKVIEAYQAGDIRLAREILTGDFAKHSRETIHIIARLNDVVTGNKSQVDFEV